MKKPGVLYPPNYELADIRSIQAVADYAALAERPPEEGEPAAPAPSPHDCKRMLDWIVHQAAATYINGFVANDLNGRSAAFMDGRQFVGQELIKRMQIKPEIFEKED